MVGELLECGGAVLGEEKTVRIPAELLTVAQ